MNDVIVRVEGLSHRYTRDWAIEELTFDIAREGVMGLLGSNGAGKSTFMNIICGVLYQTKGTVFINGINIREHPLKARGQLGFLPQQAPLHLELTVHEYLKHCAVLKKIEAKIVNRAIDAVMSKCGIAHFRNRLISNLSGGYRQRVGIAQAIIHEPSLVVLDEPTNGLDPNQILEVRKLIREIAEEQTVILSTHILSEVQAICDEIKMIELGRIVFAGTTREFNDYIEPHKILVTLENRPPKQDLEKIDGINGVEILSRETVRLSFEGGQEVAEEVIKTSITKGWSLREINFERSSLDEVFAQLSSETLSIQKNQKPKSVPSEAGSSG